jgi:hypothetical protein
MKFIVTIGQKYTYIIVVPHFDVYRIEVKNFIIAKYRFMVGAGTVRLIAKYANETNSS